MENGMVYSSNQRGVRKRLSMDDEACTFYHQQPEPLQHVLFLGPFAVMSCSLTV